MEAVNKYTRAMRGAPADSLFGQFCLHALWFGNCNIRAIAVLWIDFVREIRWYWEESERLPRMKSSSTIDLSYCLIHQKLQMVHQYFPHVFRANVIYLFICIVAQYTSLMNFKKNTCIIVLLACLCLHWAQPTHALSYALLPCPDGKL